MYHRGTRRSAASFDAAATATTAAVTTSSSVYTNVVIGIIAAALLSVTLAGVVVVVVTPSASTPTPEPTSDSPASTPTRMPSPAPTQAPPSPAPTYRATPFANGACCHTVFEEFYYGDGPDEDYYQEGSAQSCISRISSAACARAAWSYAGNHNEFFPNRTCSDFMTLVENGTRTYITCPAETVTYDTERPSYASAFRSLDGTTKMCGVFSVPGYTKSTLPDGNTVSIEARLVDGDVEHGMCDDTGQYALCRDDSDCITRPGYNAGGLCVNESSVVCAENGFCDFEYMPGVAETCDDDNPCTADGCVSFGGSLTCRRFDLNDVPCDGGMCFDGECLPVAAADVCTVDGDCHLAYDPYTNYEERCYAIDGTCVDNACVYGNNSAYLLDPEQRFVFYDDGNPCTGPGICISETDTTQARYEFPPLVNGTPCGANGVCEGGYCYPGGVVTPSPSFEPIGPTGVCCSYGLPGHSWAPGSSLGCHESTILPGRNDSYCSLEYEKELPGYYLYASQIEYVSDATCASLTTLAPFGDGATRGVIKCPSAAPSRFLPTDCNAIRSIDDTYRECIVGTVDARTVIDDSMYYHSDKVGSTAGTYTNQNVFLPNVTSYYCSETGSRKCTCDASSCVLRGVGSFEDSEYENLCIDAVWCDDLTGTCEMNFTAAAVAACDDDNECTHDFCITDIVDAEAVRVCNYLNVTAGTACTGGTCDGEGACE